MHAETLKLQLSYSQYVLGKTLEGLDHADSLESPAGGGNCINWVLGHLLVARDSFLKRLGGEPVFGTEAAERYHQGKPPIAPDEEVLSLLALKDALAATHAAMVSGLDAATLELFATPVTNSPTKNPDENVGSLLAGLMFHEIYHAGQIGAIRRATGHEGILK